MISKIISILIVISFATGKFLEAKGKIPINTSTYVIYLCLGCLLLYILFKEHYKSKKEIDLREKVWLIIGVILGYEFISFSVYCMTKFV